ncbi:MAG: amidase family protein, partial [Rhodospirillaceae bacterium]|nr:amidase family protein [Rhodospirillaceae bacterium]
MTDLSLAYTPATTLARLIGEKTISPVEVVQNSLARIEEVNGALNAFCFTYPDEALAQAREAERAVMAGEALGPPPRGPVAPQDPTPPQGERATPRPRFRVGLGPGRGPLPFGRLQLLGAAGPPGQRPGRLPRHDRA